MECLECKLLEMTKLSMDEAKSLEQEKVKQ